MRVKSIKLPTGYSLKQVRDFCREMRRYDIMSLNGFGRDTIADYFGGKDISRQLRRCGLIEPKRKHTFRRGKKNQLIERINGPILPGRYTLTKLGWRLSTAALIPPISRAKAEQIVADLVPRAIAINDDPEMLFRVSKLTVYGSYLKTSRMLSDVDVDYELDEKIDDYDEFKKAAKARSDMKQSGWSWRVDEVDFVKREVRRRLRGKVRSLHMSEGQFRRKEFRVRRKQVIFEIGAK